MRLAKDLEKQEEYPALTRVATIFASIMTLFSRHGFEAPAQKHHHENRLGKINRRSQFLALATAQLTGRPSLKTLVSNLVAQA